jgi:hypothetical protein
MLIVRLQKACSIFTEKILNEYSKLCTFHVKDESEVAYGMTPVSLVCQNFDGVGGHTVPQK